MVKTMKLRRLIIALLLIVIASPLWASPLTIRCNAQNVSFGNVVEDWKFEIVLPETLNKFVSLLGKGDELININSWPVGKGKVAISLTTGKEKLNYTRDLVVTSLPDDKNSFRGVFFTDMYVHIIRVEWWKAKKPFYFYNSQFGETITGECS